MSVSAHDYAIERLIEDAKNNLLQLPALQRRYVWKSTQVRDFLDSLYHQYPTGQLLMWDTDDNAFVRDMSVEGVSFNHRHPQLLLDGQQRLTSLYAIMTGEELLVRDRARGIDILFNVESEQFQVSDAARSRQPLWVSVTRVFTEGVLAVFNGLGLEYSTPEAQQALTHLTQLEAIKRYNYRVIVLGGLEYDEVADIFVRINSGGTRLNNADLALAQVSVRWRDVLNEIHVFQLEARSKGWELDESILLRVISAIATDQAKLSQLFKAGRSETLSGEKLRDAWRRAVPAMRQAIDFIRINCLIDRLAMLPTNYVLVPLTLFFSRHQHVSQERERELRRWLYMALMWARYSGSSETNLDQDIRALSDESPVQRMIQNIEDKIGAGRQVTERELDGELSNSPFMVMAYVLARANGAKDWFNGIAIGPGQDLEYHHIVPKSLLTEVSYRSANQIANLAFLSQKANAHIAASDPSQYLPAIEPRRLEEQYVPRDQMLWSIPRYEDFARARRVALANAINHLVHSLQENPQPLQRDLTQQLDARVTAIEQDLRLLIHDHLSVEYGASAWKRGVPEDIKRNIEPRLLQRAQRYPFEAEALETFAGRLAQASFGDYAAIIRMNWDIFARIFVNKAMFDRQMIPVQDARNAIAHHRDMNEGEQHAAAGGLFWFEGCLRNATNASDDTNDSSEPSEGEQQAG